MNDLLHVLLIADTRVKISYEIILGMSEYVKMTTDWLIEKDISYYSSSLKISIKDIKKRHLEGLVCLIPSLQGWWPGLSSVKNTRASETRKHDADEVKRSRKEHGCD